MSKGQYRVIREFILFAVGVAIAAFVVVSFQSVQSGTSSLATKDQLLSVSNQVAGGIIKVIESGSNSALRMEIPEDISGQQYKISLNGDWITASLLDNPETNVSQKLFNISQTYVISGEVAGSAKYIELFLEDNNIVLRRTVYI